MKVTRQAKIIHLFFLLIFLFVVAPAVHGQTAIGGDTLNKYAKVTGVGIDSVYVTDVTDFAAGDTVLIVQMKGARIDTATTQFGYVTNYHGNIGHYEFLIIKNIEVGNKLIIFSSNLLGSYNEASSVQLVTVPSFDEAVVTSELSCQPWDDVTQTGGVLAFISKGSLILNNNIDVSGKGFKGGVLDNIRGLCIDAGNAAWMDLEYFPEDTLNAGRKGDGLASNVKGGAPIVLDRYSRGKKYISTGGGGGNGRFSGGGGGASFGNGGNGGRDECANPVGGVGGLAIEEGPLPYKPVILGGGAGAGGRISGTSSSGASGGGIVFILADSIYGNGNSILANGDSVSVVTSGEAGAPGGGGAGSLVISSKSYDNGTNLLLKAAGGRGGHTTETSGEGGGGSGGLVYTTTDIATEPSVSVSISGGKKGRISYAGGTSVFPSGADGQEIDGLAMRLNGFLFNSIVSVVSNSAIDSICFGQVPYQIVGTQPVGGQPFYTYLWQRSYDNISWATYPGSGSTMHFTPDIAETDTVWFRRVVSDQSLPTAISDTSKAVKFIVQPLITGNDVGYDTIICINQDPDPILPINTIGGGNGEYAYWWGASDENTSLPWASADPPYTNDSYDPLVLSDTMYYYRVVVSGRCISTSNIVEVRVLPDITGNTIGTDQIICEDRLFADLTGAIPLGGDGSYVYEWRISSDNSIFNPAPGTINGQNYDPDEATFLRDQDQYLQRVVWSGADNVCSNVSASVTLKMWSDITGNLITSDQTICEGDPIAPLTTLVALGGGDTGSAYPARWEYSEDNLTWFDTGVTNEDYPVVVLTDTTWFRRIITQTECEDTSNVVVINVHPLISNNTIETLAGSPDTILCFNGDPHPLFGSQPLGGDELTYTYLWEQSPDNSTWGPADGVNSNIDYDPGVLSSTLYYRRLVSSGMCSNISPTVAVLILPAITGNNIYLDQTVCYNTVPDQLTGDVLGGGDGSPYTFLWEESSDNITFNPANGINDQEFYTPPALTIPMNYRRVVKDGASDCCIDTSNTISIGIYTLPTGDIPAVPADTTCAGSEVTISINLTGLAPYDVLLGDANGNNPSFVATSDIFDYKYNPASALDYTYSFVSIEDANGCFATSMTGSQDHKVYEVPTPDAGADQEVCGLTVALSATPSVGSGTWYSFDASITNATAATSVSNSVTVADYGTYTFWWKEINWTCTDSSSVDVTFYEQPPATFAGYDTTLIPFTDELILNADPATVGSGLWTTIPPGGSQSFSLASDPNATVSQLVDGVNELMWTVTNGVCPTVSAVLKLTVKLLDIKSGFSPNGDPWNEYFVIEGLTGDIKSELVITDINGTVVFRVNDYDNIEGGDHYWYGQDLNNNLLPDGTYYYFLKIILEGTVVQKKGFVVIKRSI